MLVHDIKDIKNGRIITRDDEKTDYKGFKISKSVTGLKAELRRQGLVEGNFFKTVDSVQDQIQELEEKRDQARAMGYAGDQYQEEIDKLQKDTDYDSKDEETFYVTAGNNSTDLGKVGTASTIEQARRIGKSAVQRSLPYGEGFYMVKRQDGLVVASGENSIRTGFKWIQKDSKDDLEEMIYKMAREEADKPFNDDGTIRTPEQAQLAYEKWYKIIKSRYKNDSRTVGRVKDKKTKDVLSDFDKKQLERGKYLKIILPAGMGEPLYTDSFRSAIVMAKEYGKGTQIVNLKKETKDVGMQGACGGQRKFDGSGMGIGNFRNGKDIFTQDPLTEKGKEIMGAMKKQYGEKKGEQVFYASKNKGAISGVDVKDKKTKDEYKRMSTAELQKKAKEGYFELQSDPKPRNHSIVLNSIWNNPSLDSKHRR